jgi:hypothetical protein
MNSDAGLNYLEKYIQITQGNYKHFTFGSLRPWFPVAVI